MYRKGGRYGPYWFAYDDVEKESPWRPIAGAFTRFGDVLPLLENMGMRVTDERPFEVRLNSGNTARIYDFGLSFPQDHVSRGADDPETRRLGPGAPDVLLTDVVLATWPG